MPELPEVETIRNDLKERILHKKIRSVLVLDKKVVKNDLKKFQFGLVGKKIVNIGRKGKLLYFCLSDRQYLLVHLRMTGQLIYVKKEKITAGGHSQKAMDLKLPNKFTRVVISFFDQGILFYNDLRKFGVLKIVDEKSLEGELKKYGVEPLEKRFSATWLGKELVRRNNNIKAFLLDQKHIAGLGNIYADEVLFFAKVNPCRRANDLKKDEIKKIAEGAKKIIKLAIKWRGTTFNDYRDAGGKKGKFLKLLKVYGRGKEKCLRCGHILKKEKIAGRGTVFCSNCQF